MRDKKRVVLEERPVAGVRIKNELSRGDALVEDIGVDGGRYQVVIAVDYKNRLVIDLRVII